MDDASNEFDVDRFAIAQAMQQIEVAEGLIERAEKVLLAIAARRKEAWVSSWLED